MNMTFPKSLKFRNWGSQTALRSFPGILLSGNLSEPPTVGFCFAKGTMDEKNRENGAKNSQLLRLTGFLVLHTSTWPFLGVMHSDHSLLPESHRGFLSLHLQSQRRACAEGAPNTPSKNTFLRSSFHGLIGDFYWEPARWSSKDPLRG